MTEIRVDKSDSDISTDSWTFLGDVSNQDDETTESSDNIVEVESESQKSEENVDDKTETKHDDSFLSFDEFLQERLLEHDYEQQEKPRKLKKVYKRRLKICKSPKKIGISVLITIILALSAFATLCSTLSQTTAGKEVEVAMRHQPEIKKPTQYKQVMQQHNDTMKEMEENLKKINLVLPDSVHRNVSSQNGTEKPSPKFFPTLDTCALRSPYVKRPNRVKAKVTPINWAIFKEILFHKNLHILISVMHVINLVAFFADFARKPSHKNKKCQAKQQFLSDLEKCNNIEEIKRYLFMQLPFWNCDMIPQDRRKATLVKTTRSVIIKPKKTSSVAVVNQKKEIINSILFRTCPFFSEHVLSSKGDEAGKSECQRRFDELDSHQQKYENLKQTQRNRIRLLKQKFRNEVSHIRDTEGESEARAEKINRTSQMFIRKLKLNREKYLLELKKVRELRRKIAEARKENGSRDVSVENHAVSLPPIYNYGQRFKMIKEKFERENDHLPKEFKFQ